MSPEINKENDLDKGIEPDNEKENSNNYEALHDDLRDDIDYAPDDDDLIPNDDDDNNG